MTLSEQFASFLALRTWERETARDDVNDPDHPAQQDPSELEETR